MKLFVYTCNAKVPVTHVIITFRNLQWIIVCVCLREKELMKHYCYLCDVFDAYIQL